jgi:hypothetical protein
MAKITGILCQMITGHVEDAGTDGDIYLGLGGREFHLDSTADDFERSSYREYIMGAPPIPPSTTPPPRVQVLNQDKNDPRKGYPLDTNNLSRTPVYIRFEPQPSAPDHWNLNFAAVLVYDTKFVIGYTPPPFFDNLWFGHQSGNILYLTNEHTTGGDAKLLATVRKLAAQLKK